MKTRTIPAGQFKAECLAVMDQVQRKRESVVVTKRGKPVVMIIPAEPQRDDIFGFFVGKGKITGNVVSPVMSRKEWGNLA